MSPITKTPPSPPRSEHLAPLRRISRALFAPIDIGMLVVFRVAFGCSMLIEVYRYFNLGSDGITRIQRNYLDPPVHFTFYGFPWVQPFPGDGMYVLFGVLGVAAFLMTIGLLYRLAALTFFLGFTYVFLLDEAVYLNHFYLICLLSAISVILPANRAWSADALLRPSIHSWTVPAWTLWLLRFQIGVAYFYGGIAKMNSDWITGVPMYLMMSSRTDFPVVGQFFHETWMIYLYAWGGMLFDLLIVPLLLWRRTRTAAFIAAVLFHTSNAKMFNIGIFPLVMVAVTIIFFPPDWLRSKNRTDDPAAANDQPQRWTWWRKLVAGVVVVHVVAQILIPFRHFLYPGEVSWTEEGHRFAWHMKLRSKRPAAPAAFLVRDETGQTLEPSEWHSPDLELTDRQARKMAGQPDMLLQYAHLIRDHLQARGHEEVHVYAYTSLSLNGRAPQPLVDPEVDLAAEPRNLRHADWIVPLYQPLPTLHEIQARLQEESDSESFD
jgi:hypothetical protein